jgi:hypothetical protein
MDAPPTSLAEYVHPPPWAMRDFRSAGLENLAREAPIRVPPPFGGSYQTDRRSEGRRRNPTAIMLGVEFLHTPFD